MLNGLALFAGIGGIELALRRWVRTVCYVERDEYAAAVLMSRMRSGDLDEAPIWDDVCSLDKPCLDMILSYSQEDQSMAGKLKKLTEEQVATALDGYHQGMSLQDLAHIYSVTRQSMWDLLRRRTTLRPQLRYGEDNHFYRGGARADGEAQDILESAMRDGEVVNPERCSGCGSGAHFRDGRTAIQGHHPDYNAPLDVEWLCQRCHHDWHRLNKPIAKRGKGKPAGIDIVTAGFP